MILNGYSQKYDKDVAPFIRNGILIDTSILKILLDGLIAVRFSRKSIDELPEYRLVSDTIDYLKIKGRWQMLRITPQIFTELWSHFHKRYNDWDNFDKLVADIFPFLKESKENIIEKHKVIDCKHFKEPILEIGDISIVVAAEEYISSEKKIAIFAKDRKLNDVYRKDDRVLVIDYELLEATLA